ncbi:MAG: helix-turn-helix domain-containing protein [Chloroflexota bacterium]|nr:helix-turn-helix domain-containing protein [Chloroflexota bacterium]
MSDKVRAWVWDLELPPARKLILLWLAGRATDNGVAFPGEREIRLKTGLGERMVRYHLQALADYDVDGPRDTPGPLLLRVERRVRADRNTSNVYILRVPWAEPTAVRRDLEELRHIPESAFREVLARIGVGATGCPQVASSDGNGLPPVGATGCPEVGATGCREESSLGNRHQYTSPVPPVGAQQQQGLTNESTKTAPDRARAESPRVIGARKLVEAFYRGLGGEVMAVTAAIQRRDLVIAGDLIAAGLHRPRPNPTRLKRARSVDALHPSNCAASNANVWDGWPAGSAIIVRAVATSTVRASPHRGK